MMYLFFDEESIGPKGPKARALSFGYVLTDENFNIIKQDNYWFNPEISPEEHDWYALKKIVKLKYKDIKELKTTFKSYHKRIKKLIEQKDVLCFGFQIDNDICYLLNSSLYYNLESIDFPYVDVRKIIKALTNQKSSGLQVEYMRYCGNLPANAHNSEYDALMTMKLLQAICKKYKVNLNNFLDKNGKCIGHVKDFCFGYSGKENNDIRKLKEKEYLPRPRNSTINARNKIGQENWLMKGSRNWILFTRLLDTIKPNEKGKLKGMKISISLNYEMYNFENMVKLVTVISEAGGIYVKKASLADLFVTYDPVYDDKGVLRKCTKLNNVLDACENGADIGIIDFDRFLKMLKLNRKKLEEMNPIDISYLDNEKYKK